VFLPADAKGKGLLFLWHGLGDNAKNFSTVFALKTIADKLGLAVVAPDSCCNTPGAGACCNLTTAWNFIDHQERDLELFDTVRQCMAQQHGVDTKRLYTMGFSAGALWSTTLVIHRSEALAAAAVLSGGVNSFVAWQVPKAKVPVLAAAGGQNDVFGGGLVDFQASTEEFEKELRKAGHFVVHCQHQQGHTVPGDIATFAVQFLQPHVQGQPLPFQGGLPGTAPAACKILP
jgi:poly(3-hydroxybutyrate) depolymerase